MLIARLSGGWSLDDKTCKLLHRILNGLTIVVGQCELAQDGTHEDANRRLRVIEAQAKELAALVLQHECQIAQENAPEREKKQPESVGNRAWEKLRKWSSMAAD
jgi:hypothetical protein